MKTLQFLALVLTALALVPGGAHLLRGFVFALVALLGLVATLAIFFAFTYPANQATNNWTEIPQNWEELRRQWEISHAVNACITFLGFCSLVISVLLDEK